VDITAARTWHWSDFDTTQNLTVTIDQSKFKSSWSVYYDGVGLRVSTNTGTDTSDITLDTSKYANRVSGFSLFNSKINTTNLANVYNKAVRATDVWNTWPYNLQGYGMNVAVVDSGIVNSSDINTRLLKSVNFDTDYHDSADRYGHGTFVSSIIAGNGTQSKSILGLLRRLI